MAEIHVANRYFEAGWRPFQARTSMPAASAAHSSQDLAATFEANLELCPRATRALPTRWPGGAVSPRPGPPAARIPETCSGDAGNAAWLESLPGKPVFVGYPVASMISCLSIEVLDGFTVFVFSHSARISRPAIVLLASNIGHPPRDAMPRAWFDNLPHTQALDDAKGQRSLQH